MEKIAIVFILAALLPLFICPNAGAGPYSDALEGIPGFVDEKVNPVFAGWATGYLNYSPTEGVDGDWLTPELTLGEVTGNVFDIASLGDLNAYQISMGVSPGEITLTFDAPIFNGDGADFAVFENGFISAGGAGTAGDIFAELAYVEVSTDGEAFVRFPSISLTDAPPGGYGTIDATDVYNLAGKHVNGYGNSYGTPFDLEELAESSDIDVNCIRYVRIVDIPGSGDFPDSAGNPIYDAWVTWGSGGFDLDAVGVIHQKILGDADNNRFVELKDAIIPLQIVSELRSAQTSTFILGDCNFDNQVNLSDAILPLQILTGSDG